MSESKTPKYNAKPGEFDRWPEPEPDSWDCLYCRDTGRIASTGYECLHCRKGLDMIVERGRRIDEQKAYKRLRYGICSERECNEPIVGWCDTCDRQHVRAPKLCAVHLQQHLSLMSRFPHIAWLYETSLPDLLADPAKHGE